MLSQLTIFGFVAAAIAQGVTERLTPDAPAPPGCRTSDDRTFSISTVNATTAARLVKRQDDMGELTIELDNGVLTSNRGDTGYIADNDQFQFDSPPQTGAVFTAGFSICPNGTLALGGSTIFYSCKSGGFSNLYSASQGEQCSQVFIQAIEGDSVSSSSSTPSATASASSYNTPPPPSATSAPVSSAAPSASASSIPDGQPQVPTAAPTPSPVYTAGAPATGASLVLAGAGLLAAALL